MTHAPAVDRSAAGRAAAGAGRAASRAGVTGPAGTGGDWRPWLVGLYLPVEGRTPAEAVRAFWSYVEQLGPGQLPVFVSPAGDELAMQAYLLGEPTNLDPEEDEPAGDAG